MRTTLNIDDDLLVVAKRLAREQSVSIGRVISDLAREGLRRSQVHVDTKFRLFDVPADAPKITAEMVQLLLNDEV